MPTATVLECKSGSIAEKKRLVCESDFITIRQKTAQPSVYKQIISKRSKLTNFAPKILLCAGRGVLSIRNANIVSDDKTSEF